jgi:translation initiation factor eIF-2B subunit beta
MPPLQSVLEGMASMSLSSAHTHRHRNHHHHSKSQRYESLTIDQVPVREWLVLHHRKQLTLLDKFLLDLRVGRLANNNSSNYHNHNNVSFPDRRVIVHKTLEVLRQFIGGTKWKSAAHLLTLLRWVGHELHQATGGGTREPALLNVVRRLMAVVREEAVREDSPPTTTTTSDAQASSFALASQSTSPPQQRPSLAFAMLWSLPQKPKMRERQDSMASETDVYASTSSMHSTNDYPALYYQHRPDLKSILMEAMEEFMNDVQDMHKLINDQATQFIHPNDSAGQSAPVILTCGRSRTVALFLQAAQAKKRSFHLLVVGSPDQAQALHKTLGLNDTTTTGTITITCVPHAAVFALMPRVHQVLLPVHAVLANGGLVTASGSLSVAMAAHYHAKPVLALTGLYKLCPLFPHEGADTLNDLLSPAIPPSASSSQTPGLLPCSYAASQAYPYVEWIRPVQDSIAPEYISLYVTNVGSFHPSFIYRLLAEYYHADDWDSFE